MQRMRTRLHSGSRAENWEQEWRGAEETERLEAQLDSAQRTHRRLVRLGPVALLGALLPAIFPLTPGFSPSNTVATVVAAAVAAGAAVAIVPATTVVARGFRRAAMQDGLVLALAVSSVGAGAIHLAVAKPHFDEYTLFGVFFVGSGLAQVAWAIWLLLRPWRPLLWLGALGNGSIVALWAVDRIWGLPLGPEHWKPETVGFGDSVTAAFELLLVGGCLALLARRRERPVNTGLAGAIVLVGAALTALSLLSVLGVGSSFLTPTG